MTFCQKDFHSFLGFSSNIKGNGTVDLDSIFHRQNPTMKSTLFSSPVRSGDSMMAAPKKDPGGIGFLYEVGGRVDGLMSCTESLGFESSDERRVVDQIEIGLSYEMGSNPRKESTMAVGSSRWKREHGKREVKKFPPPLSSLDQNGKPTFFLRPVRKDGKLELQEVKIGRPGILRASRQDGRLRLHLASNEEEDYEEQNREEKETEEEMMQENQENVQEMIGREMGEEGTAESCVEEEERVEGWQIQASPGGMEGLRRCHEQVSHHHQNDHQHDRRHHHRPHHDLHVWSQAVSIV